MPKRPTLVIDPTKALMMARGLCIVGSRLQKKSAIAFYRQSLRSIFGMAAQSVKGDIHLQQYPRGNG